MNALRWVVAAAVLVLVAFGVLALIGAARTLARRLLAPMPEPEWDLIDEVDGEDHSSQPTGAEDPRAPSAGNRQGAGTSTAGGGPLAIH